MAVNRGTARIDHLAFPDLPDLLRKGDLLVRNDTKVIRGRLRARKETGAAVEILLLSSRSAVGGREETWEVLARPSKRIREGMGFRVGEDLTVTFSRRLGNGRWEAVLSAGLPVPEVLERAGEVPLPPYIRRMPGDPALAADAKRYQTVYANHPGSVAAPTAGLHFDEDLLSDMAGRGIFTAEVTLSIGYGTFATIREENVEDHEIHPEAYRLGEETAAAIATARERSGRVVAVGTTSVRTLETCANGDGRVLPSAGTTRLFLFPGYRFRAVDAMLTNFHLPRSSLLALVMAFGGVDLVREAYRRAIEERYRLFSYGDAMFLY